jgi:Ran GTPase-activating protein (RanGAP) involved in mRNA processing and transport
LFLHEFDEIFFFFLEPIPYQNLELEQKIQQYCSHSTIDLRGQKLTDKDMKIIVKYAIKQKQCEELELGSNEITLDGVRILAAALTNNKTLSYLSLWDNCLCDNSVSCLVEMLSINNNNLTILNLGKNEITDIGAKELAKILQTNQTLTELYLGDNRISHEGVRILADSIENYNTTLERLFLFSNQSITDECVRHLLQLIMHNNTLKELSLNNCNLSKRSKEKLQMAARKVNFKLDVG